MSSKKVKKLQITLIDDNTGEEGVVSVRREFDENGNLLIDERLPDGIHFGQKIVRTYDAAGRILQEASYSDGEDPDMEVLFEYDDSGRLLRTETRYMAGNATIAYHEHDARDNSEKVRIEDDEGALEEVHFLRTDSSGRLLEEKITGADGRVISWVNRAFDDAGRPVSARTQDEDGNIHQESWEYEFDEMGRLVYLVLKDEAGRVLREEEYEYDEKGNPTEWRYEDHRRSRVGIETREYDDQGRLLRRQLVSPGGTPLEEEMIAYNDLGQVAEREIIVPQGASLQLYQYEYY